jgi:hypothetical protein
MDVIDEALYIRPVHFLTLDNDSYYDTINKLMEHEGLQKL